MTIEEYIQEITHAQWLEEKDGPTFAPEQALPICDEALKKFPQAAPLYYMKACVLWNQSQEASLELFSHLLEKAAKLDPEWAKSVLKTYKYQVGGKELIWMDYDYLYNNLYIKGLWNMKDTLGHDDSCTALRTHSYNDTFSFFAFNGFRVDMQIRGDIIKCVDIIFAK